MARGHDSISNIKESCRIWYLSQREKCHGDVSIIKCGNKLLQETDIHVERRHKVLVNVLHVGIRKDVLAVRRNEVYCQWAAKECATKL